MRSSPTLVWGTAVGAEPVRAVTERGGRSDSRNSSAMHTLVGVCRKMQEIYTGGLIESAIPAPPRGKKKGAPRSRLRDRGGLRTPGSAAGHALPPPCISGTFAHVMKIMPRGSGGGRWWP